RGVDRVLAPAHRQRRRLGRRADARGGEDELERRPLAELARDVELAAVALHDVLDDRKAEAGPARFARAAALDAIETLGQARQVRARDAGPGVAHRDLAAAVVGDAPLDVDAAALGRVADRVADEIAERAAQLGLVAGDLRTDTRRERDRVALGR